MKIPDLVLSVARRTNHPVYVYDLAILRERLRRLEALPLDDKRIHFASMANDHPAVLSEIAKAGHGVFVNSPGHLAVARSAGVPAALIIYAASNMTRAEMEFCIGAGVHIVLDSPGQVRDFDAIALPGTKIGIRVNVGSAVDGDILRPEPSYRFGHLPDEVRDVLGAVRNVRIVGVHSYFGTDIMDPDILLDGLEHLIRLGAGLPDLEYIDAGGGFGIADDFEAAPFDLQAYGRGAARIMDRLQKELGRRITLVIEPGRWLAAPCGWFFARIVDIKDRPDRIFAGTDASVAQFPRLLVYPDKARHPCVLPDAEGRPDAAKPVWISGNSTYSRDFLARAIPLAAPRVNDLVAFHHAGAYCRSMLSQFLGKCKPEEVIIDTAFAVQPVDVPVVEAAE